MKSNKEEDNSHPHFVAVTCPVKASHLINIYTGPRDKFGIHTHSVLSGAIVVELWYSRDIDGNVIVKDGKIKIKDL